MGLKTNAVIDQTPVQVSTEFVENLLADYPRRDFQFRLWDGSTWGSDEQGRFSIVLKHPGALREMFLSPSELTLGEAYIFDDFDIEGNIEAAFDLSDYLLSKGSPSFRHSLHLASLLRKLPVSQRTRSDRRRAGLRGPIHSKERDSQAISYHYDSASGVLRTLARSTYGIFLRLFRRSRRN